MSISISFFVLSSHISIKDKNLLFFIFSNAAPKATFMAKQSERIEKKVFQQFLCAPSFKKEIMDLGNKG